MNSKGSLSFFSMEAQIIQVCMYVADTASCTPARETLQVAAHSSYSPVIPTWITEEITFFLLTNTTKMCYKMNDIVNSVIFYPWSFNCNCVPALGNPPPIKSWLVGVSGNCPVFFSCTSAITLQVKNLFFTAWEDEHVAQEHVRKMPPA